MYLAYLGYAVDRTDNYFSQASSEALKQFQRDHDLNVTGRSDEATWKALEDNVLLEINKNEAKDDTQRQKAIEMITQE
ncbi:peptidoglycan-binding domain-containing protein [uncultured Dubosiella sp.]